ncbi:MAG: NAD(P)-dependent oxidoreductase [Vicinamibacterales bacterium]
MTSGRVLVTGGTGCVGRQVLPLLVDRGWEVHATSSKPAPPDVTGVHWHTTNLLEAGQPERVVAAVRPDALLHLAWYIAPRHWAEAPANLAWVTASLDLARAFREAGGRRLVGAGSGLEYDWGYGYCSELRTPCVPHTLYGTSKHALRLLLEAGSAGSGTSVAWGRIFFLFGPHEHEDRLIPYVIRAPLQGQRARCSHGRQVRDYLFAGDVASALVRLLERDDVRGPINIASGQAITLRALVERVGDLLGRSELIDFGAIPAAATDTPLVVGDVTRLGAELGWSPAGSLDDGLRTTIAWWARELERRVGATR